MEKCLMESLTYFCQDRQHMPNKKATTRSKFIAERNSDVNNITILRVTQQCFHGEFTSPATIPRTYVSKYSSRYFARSHSNLESHPDRFSQKSPNTKFHGLAAAAKTDGRT